MRVEMEVRGRCMGLDKPSVRLSYGSCDILLAHVIALRGAGWIQHSRTKLDVGAKFYPRFGSGCCDPIIGVPCFAHTPKLTFIFTSFVGIKLFCCGCRNRLWY